MEVNFQKAQSDFFYSFTTSEKIALSPNVFAIDTIEQFASEKPTSSKGCFCWTLITAPFVKLYEMITWVFQKIFCCFYSKSMNDQEIIDQLNKLIGIVKTGEIEKSSEYMKIFNSLPRSTLNELKESAIEAYFDKKNENPFTQDNKKEWKEQNAFFIDTMATAMLTDCAENACAEILKAYVKKLEAQKDNKS